MVALGTASEVTDPAEIEHLASLQLAPWVRSADLSHTIAIPVAHLAGRRLVGV